MQRFFAIGLLLSTHMLANAARAESCASYVLTVGPAGPEYVALQSSTLKGYNQREKALREARETEARLNRLAADVRAAAKESGWGSWLRRNSPLALARSAYRTERNNAVSPRNQRASILVHEAKLVSDLHDEAVRVLQRSLHQPAPVWAKAFKFTGHPTVTPLDDGFEAVVDVQAGEHLIEVYFSNTLANGFKAGVVRDEELSEADHYFYDAFKIGTVLDGDHKTRVAHTSLDWSLRELTKPAFSREQRASADPRLPALYQRMLSHKLRASLTARMAQSPVLRRQVHQVLRAAVRLVRPGDFDRLVVVYSYLYYWAGAEFRHETKMLSSSFMIAGLTPQFALPYLADAIATETDKSHVDLEAIGFDHRRVKGRLIDNERGIPKGYQEILFWNYVRLLNDAPSGADINHHDLHAAEEKELGERTALHNFDSKNFIAHEQSAYPGAIEFPKTEDHAH